MRQAIIAILVGMMPAVALAGTDARPGQVEVLAFTSKHCGQCQRDKPELDRLRTEGVAITEIDVEEYPEVADRYNVRRLPTYVVLKDGVEVERTGDVGVLGTLLIAILVFLFCG